MEGIKSNILYNYGVINAFINGLFRGTLSLKKLKTKGNFGLGAPNFIDGELTILDGKAYQTKYTGETIELKDDHLTPFASATFFEPEKSFIIKNSRGKDSIFKAIESHFSSENYMYAIKISGEFEQVQTRAFPPEKKEPFPKLEDILYKQHFFDFQDTQGDLVGFYLPKYLNGVNKSGFHFHFLSKDKKQGGHVLDFTSSNLKIELSRLKSLELEMPTDDAFMDYNFKKMDNEALRKVEQGGVQSLVE